MNKISNKDLNTLIKGLKQYKEKGVHDPWVLSDGTKIEPLDVLIELKELRKIVDNEDFKSKIRKK